MVRTLGCGNFLFIFSDLEDGWGFGVLTGISLGAEAPVFVAAVDVRAEARPLPGEGWAVFALAHVSQRRDLGHPRVWR